MKFVLEILIPIKSGQINIGMGKLNKVNYAIL